MGKQGEHSDYRYVYGDFSCVMLWITTVFLVDSSYVQKVDYSYDESFRGGFIGTSLLTGCWGNASRRENSPRGQRVQKALAPSFNPCGVLHVDPGGTPGAQVLMNMDNSVAPNSRFRSFATILGFLYQ